MKYFTQMAARNFINYANVIFFVLMQGLKFFYYMIGQSCWGESENKMDQKLVSGSRFSKLNQFDEIILMKRSHNAIYFTGPTTKLWFLVNSCARFQNFNNARNFALRVFQARNLLKNILCEFLKGKIAKKKGDFTLKLIRGWSFKTVLQHQSKRNGPFRNADWLAAILSW